MGTVHGDASLRAAVAELAAWQARLEQVGEPERAQGRQRRQHEANPAELKEKADTRDRTCRPAGDALRTDARDCLRELSRREVDAGLSAR